MRIENNSERMGLPLHGPLRDGDKDTLLLEKALAPKIQQKLVLSATALQFDSQSFIRLAWLLCASRYTAALYVVAAEWIDSRSSRLALTFDENTPLPELLAQLVSQTETITEPQCPANKEPYFTVSLTFRGSEPVPALASTRPCLQVALTQQSILFSFNLPAETWSERSAEDLAATFLEILSAIAAKPGRLVRDVRLLDGTQLKRILRSRNQTSARYPRTHSICELFEKQADLRRQHIAVVHGHEETDYQTLNERVNQLAHYLISKGVKREDHLVVFADRSQDCLVAILASMKAGAAYVPIDPAYARSRVDYILRDAKPKWLLTQQHLLEQVPETTTPLFVLDRDAPLLSKMPCHNPGRRILPQQLAYIIYTSGSSGKPKGVWIQHCGLVNLVWAMTGFWPIDHSSRMLQFASMSFDASVPEWAGPLMRGATIVLKPARELALGDGLIELMIEQNITLAKMPSAALRSLPRRQVPSLKTLITAGDACTESLVDFWADGRRFFNCYGPTEMSIGATMARCKPAEGHPSIGIPNPNTRAYILDRNLQPMPDGFSGELFLAGDGVARGYLNRPALTAHSFVPNPFEPDGQRLYRSGDIARYLSDGRLDFQGRVDDQIKIRGFRVELGEIEARLQAHEMVNQAAVLGRTIGNGDPLLVAYISCSNNAFRLVRLRTDLAADLPDYMLPAAYVVLETLPLTTNGKIDKKALPVPEARDYEREVALQPASNVAQQLMLDIWKEVLAVEAIGIHDNFFHLGGHSLTVVQVVSRIQQDLGIRPSMTDFFTYATVAGLSQRLRQLGHRPDEPLLWAKADDLRELASVADLIAEPDAVLHQQLAKRLRDTRRRATLVPRRDTTQAAPLSFGQQQLWVLYKLMPQSPFYNITMAFLLKGNLDRKRMTEALTALVQRQQSLRTVYRQSGNTVYQHQLEVKPAWQFQDLTGRVDDLSAIMKYEANKPFDLIKGPVMNAHLFRLADQQHVLQINLHHIAADGGSMSILLRELAIAYQTDADQRQKLPLQFTDFAAWQRAELSSDRLQAQLDHWRERLAGVPTTLQLPTDYARTGKRRFLGDQVHFTIQGKKLAAFKRFAHASEATLFQFLLAGYGLLLARYSGQDDLLIGAPVSGRSLPELEALIGFFSNTLLFRCNLQGEPSFQTYLQRLITEVRAASDNQDLPFQQLVEHLVPNRNPSYSPLFQVLFAYQKKEHSNSLFEGLAVEPLTVNPATSKFDLTLLIDDSPTALICYLEFDTDLFSKQTAQRMVVHFVRLLSAAIREPDKAVSDLNMLNETEHRAIARRAWAEQAVYSHRSLVQDRFEALAEADPQAIAVVLDASKLTRAELDARANRWAHQLRQLGVRADDPVAVCLEPKSFEVLIALLAIAKAGGCYVAVNDKYPKTRIIAMLNHCQPKVLLVHSPTAPRFDSWQGKVLVMDQEPIVEDKPDTKPRQNVSSDNLSFMVYTSGSTGQPKGVAVPHRTLTNLANWQMAQAWNRPDLKVMQFSSTSFDASLQEMYFALSAGYPFVLSDEDTRYVPERLAAFIDKHRISVIHMPTAVFHQFAALSIPNDKRLKSLRVLFVAGERLLVGDSVRELMAPLKNCRLVNFYGPSETHGVSWLEMANNDLPADPSIGKIVQNSSIHVMDRFLQPVALGLPGELCLGGVCLARGYFGQPALTAERFVPHPFGDGERLYRCGDLGRYLDEGNIDYLGRTDFQVKIRGFRVEPGEVEHILSQHAAVKQATVVALLDPSGERHLVAYLLSDEADLPELRVFLAENLPDYMLPTLLIPLPQFPITRNGKVDRRALPEPDFNAAQTCINLRRPETLLQQLLAEIWAEVLDRQDVWLDDNFFDIGGHSLRAIQVITHLQEGLQLELPLATFFEAATLVEQCRAIATLAATYDRDLETELTELEQGEE